MNNQENYMELRGLYTALVTPFSNGSIDFSKIDELIDIQLEAKIAGIVPMGTTGESPTVTTDEHLKVIERVVKRVDGRCKVIAGTGANSTHEAIHLTEEAKAMGVDASLQVTPYYNKPSQEGLYLHFSRIADIGLPVILYNVPGRSGVQIDIDTIVRLSRHSNIVAVKEAGGDADRVSMILNACDLTVLSGDDALTLPMMSVGAKGVISVLSNIHPNPLREMLDMFFAGDLKRAQEIHMKYYKLMKGMFIETNPVPVKTAMARIGLINEEYRLPICSISEANRKRLYQLMDEFVALDTELCKFS
jgi:4-hydroxy-tetrahydrodipicolinate synthase